MRKAQRLGRLDGAIVGIGNAPTALIEVVRLIREEGLRPALVIGMPVGFVSAAESKDLLMTLDRYPVGGDQGPQGRLDAGRRRHARAARPGRSGAAEQCRLSDLGQALAPAKVRKGDPARRGNRTGLHYRRLRGRGRTAATLGLLTGVLPDSVLCRLPNGQRGAPLCRHRWLRRRGRRERAHAVVVKDAGDDPDATHGAHLTADVRRLPHRAGEVLLKGGFGVGVVTKDGLGLEVGGPAINPVPRRNIIGTTCGQWRRELLDPRRAGSDHFRARRRRNGQKDAERAPRHLGGISILGTTGIVRPYSTAAFRASVVQAVDVAAKQGQTTVIFTTGGRTEKFAMRQLPELDEACFVQMGDFVKAAFQSAVKQRIPQGLSWVRWSAS
jgi:hypothetical protein